MRIRAAGSQCLFDHRDLALPHRIVRAGPTTGHVRRRQACQRGGDRGGSRGIPDAHLAEADHVDVFRRIESLLDTDDDRREHLVGRHRGFAHHVPGARRDSPALHAHGGRLIRRDADIDDGHSRTGERGQRVDRCSAR